MCIFVSRNIFHVYLNIMIWTSKKPMTAKNEYFSKYTINSTIPKHSPTLATIMWCNFSTMCIICNHSHPVNYWHTWLQIIIQNNRNIHGTTMKVQWTSGKETCGATSSCDGVTCSWLGFGINQYLTNMM